MRNLLILAAVIVAAPVQWASAQTVAPSKISHSVMPSPASRNACENTVVCATMHDGRSVAVTDCAARHDGAVRYLYGDCSDED